MAWRIRIRSLQHSATVAVNDNRGGWRRIVFGVARIAGACKSRCKGDEAKQPVTKPSVGSPQCHRAPRPSRRLPSLLDYPEWGLPLNGEMAFFKALHSPGMCAAYYAKKQQAHRVLCRRAISC